MRRWISFHRFVDTRRLIIRISLGCLAVTAAAGVSLLFLPWVGATARLTLTALLATIVAGLCIPFGVWASKDDSRWGGLAGIAILSVQLCLAIAAIWWDYFSTGASTEVLLSFNLYFLSTSPFLILGAREVVRRPAVGYAAMGGAAAALPVFAVQAVLYRGIDGFDDGSAPLGPIAYTLLFWGGGVALGLVRRCPPRHRSVAAVPATPTTSSILEWPLLGALVTTLGALVSLWQLMGESLPRGSFLGLVDALPLILLLGAFGYAIGVANLALLPRLKGFATLIQFATAGAAALAAVTTSFWVWTSSDEWATPFVASMIILVAGGLAVLLLARFSAQPEFATGSAVLRTIELLCPRCHRRGTQPLGRSACSSCGLRFEIQVEEPRCASCGQLLHGQTADRCPECGTAVVRSAPPVIGAAAP